MLWLKANLILACIAIVEREERGKVVHSVAGEEEWGGATASMRLLSSLLLTSALLLSADTSIDTC